MLSRNRSPPGHGAASLCNTACALARRCARLRVLAGERRVLADFSLVELAEVGVSKVGIGEVGTIERRAGEHSVVKVGVLEGRGIEVGAVDDAISKVGAVEDGLG